MKKVYPPVAIIGTSIPLDQMFHVPMKIESIFMLNR